MADNIFSIKKNQLAPNEFDYNKLLPNNLIQKKIIPSSSVQKNLGNTNTSQSIQQPIQEFATPPVAQPAIQPEIPNQEEQDNSRFLASLLGQGVAMFGSGIAGRDPMKVSETFNDMRYLQQRSDERQRQIDQAKKLMDPNSQESQRKRNLYKKVLGLPISEDVSASDLEDPVVLNSLKQQSIQAQMAKMPKQIGVAQPKVDKDEQKNIQSFKDATAESNKFIKQVDDYSKLVKKIPISGGITEEGASKIAAAQALRGKLLLSLKNIEKTGALDQGMINVADGILGSADYTRESVVDARANQLKQTIKDDIESNYIKYGILGIQQGEDGNYYYVDKNNKPILKYQGNINGKN
jgi:hypothetical protein